MTNFEYIFGKNSQYDLDKAIEILEYITNKNITQNWDEWFDANYCKKCKPIDEKYSYCEKNNYHCRYITNKDLTDLSNCVIKLWLMQEYEEK